MRYLGIDYGSSKVGLALSDEAGRMGFPAGILINTPSLIDEVCELIRDKAVGAVVIGESKNFQGEDNPIAKDARALGDLIVERAGVPVFYESETLTSAEARRMQEPSEKTRAPRERGDVDASAAALILTSYLSKRETPAH